jgi:hypothetical protein
MPPTPQGCTSWSTSVRTRSRAASQAGRRGTQGRARRTSLAFAAGSTVSKRRFCPLFDMNNDHFTKTGQDKRIRIGIAKQRPFLQARAILRILQRSRPGFMTTSSSSASSQRSPATIPAMTVATSCVARTLERSVRLSIEPCSASTYSVYT